MLLQMYTVRDAVANVYGTPYFAINDGMALRSFSELVNDPRSTVYKYPNDFSLYQIGCFDDADGSIKPTWPINLVVNASALVKPIEPTTLQKDMIL